MPKRVRRLLPSPIRDLPAWAAAAWAVAQLVAASRFFATPYAVWLNVDEGIITAFALRLLDGRMLPYVDAVSQRGPMLYWAAALAARLGDPLSFAPIRALALVLWALVALATFAAGALAERPLAGAIGALSLPIVCLGVLTPWDGVAYNGELLLDAFAMLALVAAVAALGPAARRRAPRLALLAASGAFAMLAALAKQVGAVAALPLAVWVLAAAHARRELPSRHRAWMVAAFALGLAAPLLAVVALYAAAGELHRLVYWSIIYNAKVYLHPFADPEVRARALRAFVRGKILLFAAGAPLVIWALRRPFAASAGRRDLAQAVDDDGFLVTVALGTLVSVAVANAGLRDYAHYYVQAIPWAGLLFGLAVEAALASGRRRATGFAAQALVLAPLAWLAWFSWASQHLDDLRARTEGRAFQDPRRAPICAYVAAHTRPDERLFVWGFEPDLYVSCRRRPASRYVFTTYVAGFVPWFTAGSVGDDDALAAPGSRAELLADLDATRPPVIVDAGDTMGHRPMARYPVLAHWLAEHYCDDGVHSGLHTYVRRGASSNCDRH